MPKQKKKFYPRFIVRLQGNFSSPLYPYPEYLALSKAMQGFESNNGIVQPVKGMIQPVNGSILWRFTII